MSPPRSPDLAAGLEERSQAFLHRARVLRGLAPHQVARVARRLKEQRPPRRRRALSRALATLALVLMAGVAAAWASGTLEHWSRVQHLFGGRARPAATSEHPLPEVPALPPAERALGAPPADTDTASGSDAERPALAQVPADTGAAAPLRPARGAPPSERTGSPRRRASVAARRLPTAPDHAEAAIVLEGRSLAAILELWRTGHDVRAALAALDGHERRFGDGQMGVEARTLRAEILLAASRDAEALAVLDRLPLERVPRGRELRTLRGELRVRRGRCQDGRADLVPISQGADALATRAQAALVRCP